MIDAGIEPSNQMYHDVFSYAQKSVGAEYAAIIQERVGMHILISLSREFY